MHASTASTTERPDIAWQLLPALDAAAEAGRDAHRAATSLTDAVAACQRLPADVYRYTPDVFETTGALTAAGRALTSAVQAVTAARTPEALHAVHEARNTLLHTTAAVDVAVEALRTAASWYIAALPAADRS